MTNPRDHGRSAARRAFVVLAFVAVILRALAPAGYMVAPRGAQAGLVICTGHGPLLFAGHGDPKAPPHRTAEAPCAFAGAVTPPPSSSLALVREPVDALSEPVIRLWSADLAPGRGLAAPPPPARGPPASPETI